MKRDRVELEQRDPEKRRSRGEGNGNSNGPGRDRRAPGTGTPAHARDGNLKDWASSSERGWAAAIAEPGRSGYGSESVRPHLRAQLRLKELLGRPFLPPEPGEPSD